MALITSSMLPKIVRSECKQRRENLVHVIMEPLSASLYHQACMSTLLDISEKYWTMSSEIYNYKIKKISDMVTCQADACLIFQTFCQLSFLDRYQDKPIITCAMLDLDERIPQVSLQMVKKLKDKSIELLQRMSMIENLRLLDADMICLLCQLCKTSHQNVLCNELFEIGRSIWPYIKRSVMYSPVFIDLFADVFEAIGYKLEEKYTQKFTIAWKVIHKNLVISGADISHYGKLRLLGVVEHKCRNWSLPDDVLEFYRKYYKEFSDKRKKEVLALFGSLSSRRMSSLTIKPGRSAADFLKQKNRQEIDDPCSSSCGDSPDPSSEVYENVFEEDENKIHINSLMNKSTSNTEHDVSNHTNEYHEKIDQKTVLEDKHSSLQENKTMCTAENVKMNSGLIELCDSAGKLSELGEMQHEKMDESKDKKMRRKDEDITGGNTLESGNILPKSIVNNDERGHRNTSEESGTTLWLENDNKKEINDGENLCKENGNEGWKETEDVSDDRNGDSFSNKSSRTVPGHRSFLFDRKKEIMRVPSRYVGRVIGTHGSVISSIQDECGASVHMVRSPREKVGMNQEIVATDDEQEEYEFQITGSDESVVKAKCKIEDIISHTKNVENRAILKRSFSDGDEENSARFRRSFHFGRKRFIMKVASKYVGRVIGSSGNMIMTIEEESGAKVTFLNGKKAEKYRSVVEREVSAEHKSEDKTLQGAELERVPEEKENEKQPIETQREENLKESKEKIESQEEHRAFDSGRCREENPVKG